MMSFDTDHYIVDLPDDEFTVRAAYAKLVEYLIAHDAWSGEKISQSDDIQLTVRDLLAELVDEVIKPQVQLKPEEE